MSNTRNSAVVVFPTLLPCSRDSLAGFFDLPTPLPFDALNVGDPLKLSGSYLVREN